GLNASARGQPVERQEDRGSPCPAAVARQVGRAAGAGSGETAGAAIGYEYVRLPVVHRIREGRRHFGHPTGTAASPWSGHHVELRIFAVPGGTPITRADRHGLRIGTVLPKNVMPDGITARIGDRAGGEVCDQFAVGILPKAAGERPGTEFI